MSKTVCMALIMVPYVYEALIGLMETMWTYGLVFCGPNEINHFYCTDPPLLKLACSDTKIKETSMLVCAGSNLPFPSSSSWFLTFIFFSAILRMRSTEGRRKAFSICGSHPTAVTVFYETLFIMYLRPPSKESAEQGKNLQYFILQ